MNQEITDIALVWGVRIASAAAVLVIGLWLAFFVSRVARRQAEKHPRIDTTLSTFLFRLVRYALILVVIVVVLQMFGVQTASLVAIVGASALAIGLALQGTLTNVASGILVAIVRPYRIGDFVELNGKEGLVTDLDLFFTELRTKENRRVIVPNGQAIANPIVNHTTAGQRCCVIVFGIDYADDIDHAFAVLREVMVGDPRASSHPEPWFGVESLGDYSVNVSARVCVKAGDYKNYKADMLKAVKEAFDREGIEVPYPHAVEISKGEVPLRSPPIKPPVKLQPGADGAGAPAHRPDRGG
ncbi:MAG: mechanosensitive ion channel domain-containing protein [Novosphingobium sp.]